MLHIIAAPDSFKESLTAAEAAEHIAAGIHKVLPGTRVTRIPLSDGGEGLTDALISGTSGRFIRRPVTGLLGNPVTAKFGVLGDNRTAVIEMAEAAGLALVPPARRNPMITTTYGVGELMKAAWDQGCRRMIIGIGGSATNDGGSGMAEALGVRLLDESGRVIGPGTQGLLDLSRIDASAVDPRLGETEILAACDVTNPLCGPTGAAYVYGRQKGATEEMLPVLDEALRNLARVIKRDLGLEVQELSGAGAAGGMGAGLAAFAGGELRSGLGLVFELLDFESRLAAGVDLVITGEGQINGQSLFGKVPAGVARLAKKYGLPVLALVGSIGPEAEKTYEAGIDAIMSIVPGPLSLDEALARAGELVADAAARAMRIMLLNKQFRGK